MTTATEVTTRNLLNPQTRAGSHDNIPKREIDASAFSYSKAFPKPDPSKFVKAREGNGGTMVRTKAL
jgi:hypothetical protein